MTYAEPPLREPDLPRTAKVRPTALRTGWTTGACATAAAKAAVTRAVTGVPQPDLHLGLR
ncbi:cobalt-precorrin-5B (C(1))-methyltransferase, partial [Micromonospora sp. U56]|uniref:cobalt-precorrin-5B (C(1))-methyltransferase n=1 Tax=Micromonospora sp. U56 TaxID=2824900 RepID=UPI001B36B454